MAKFGADPRAELLLQMQLDLSGQRSNWEHKWEHNGRLIRPMKREFQSKYAEGQEKSQYIYDSTALMAVDNLASGLWSQITNGANRWLTLRSANDEINEDYGARRWLSDATDKLIMAFNMNGQRFYTQALELYKDLPAFGTGVMFSQYRSEQADIHFHCVPLAECYIGQNEWYEIDRLIRKFEITASQAWTAFGENAFGVNSAVRSSIEGNRPFDKHYFLHGVMPIEMRGFTFDERELELGKMYGSLWVDMQSRRVVRDGAYYEFPYQTPRWSLASRGAYGDSQADLVMPDVRMVNTMSKTTIGNAQLVTTPPLLLPSEDEVTQHNRRGLHVGAKALIYGGVTAEGQPLYRPLQAGGDIGLGLEMEEQRRLAIREGFYFSLLQMVGNPNATATEVLQREEEKLRLMGPQLSRVQSEFLDPLVDRVFSILLREGALGPEEEIPELLLEEPRLEVEYISPLARAQRITEAGAADRYVNSLAMLAEATGDEAVWDNLNIDRTSQKYGEAYSVPPEILNSPKEREAVRQQRIRQQQTAQAAELAPNVTSAMKDVSDIQQAGQDAA